MTLDPKASKLMTIVCWTALTLVVVFIALMVFMINDSLKYNQMRYNQVNSAPGNISGGYQNAPWYKEMQERSNKKYKL